MVRDQRTATAWLLAVSILLQPLLTYLATPLAGQHGNGQWTVVCTLQGEKTVFVELGPAPAEGPDACPALKLLQAFGTGSVAVPPRLPALQLYASVAIATPVDYPYIAPHFSVFPSRAPPLS